MQYLTFNNKKVIYEIFRAKECNECPKIIHRLLLYDKKFPEIVENYIKSVENNTLDFIHILWYEKDVLRIMSTEEIDVYKSYKKLIQKSDYARYIVLKYYGGIYLDLDVYLSKPLNTLYDKYKSDDLFFEEFTRTNEYVEGTKRHKIRNNSAECNFRIANYVLMFKQNSIHIENSLNICKERSNLEVLELYDVLYITGPDVMSSYFDLTENLKYISSLDSNKYFYHVAIGHWRN